MPRLAENDAGVFDGVVAVHGEVAFGVEREIGEAVPREQREHVVEERQTSADLGVAGTVEG